MTDLQWKEFEDELISVLNKHKVIPKFVIELSDNEVKILELEEYITLPEVSDEGIDSHKFKGMLISSK
jgi:hypothetical protein